MDVLLEVYLMHLMSQKNKSLQNNNDKSQNCKVCILRPNFSTNNARPMFWYQSVGGVDMVLIID